ncbi:glutamine synthetase [Rhizoctonia solani]|uniref:Glutamine synthetase n=1 Tax=Rhizoctonia solani TaxID=456999 RepID=A0A8H8PDK2_9AGAM|nr:glutamine synthetase [Rhizoctonia solani]QRW27692.1 glutamine synthetase [Rhizoctonia solani]
MTTTERAPKSVEDLHNLLQNDTKVKVAGIDVDGILRGKFMSKDKFLSAVKGEGFGFCSVIFGWDMHDLVYPNELLVSNRANGYRDILAHIDLSTYRRISWEANVPFFLLSFLDPETHEPIPVCPRGTLTKAIKSAEGFGWEPVAGVEYEYFQFKETPQTVAEKRFTNLSSLTSGKYFHDLFDESKKFGIEIEGHHTETGPGVYETALAYTSALRMADNATLFKFVAKSIGMKRGVIPSFMAKPWANYRAHSFQDAAEGRTDAQSQDTRFMSQEGEWFLAGVLDGLVDSNRPVGKCYACGIRALGLTFAQLVPTINGYKRLVGGESFWAPNAVTYGYDSRAASIRIISPPSVPPSATRLEIRVPGADMQPHFALASIFRLGLRGIEKKVQLPGPPISVLQRENKAPIRLAMSLEEGTKKLLAENSIAREVLGDDFVDHYGGTRSHEVKLWNEAVTNWEGESYAYMKFLRTFLNVTLLEVERYLELA